MIFKIFHKKRSIDSRSHSHFWGLEATVNAFLHYFIFQLETAVQYDIRSRIRAQIRLIKRQQQTKKTSRTPSPEKSVSKDNKVSECRQNVRQCTCTCNSQSVQYVRLQMTSGNQLSARTATTSESRKTVISSTPDNRDKVKKRLFSDADDSTEKKSPTTKNTTTKHARTHSRSKLSGKDVLSTCIAYLYLLSQLRTVSILKISQSICSL